MDPRITKLMLLNLAVGTEFYWHESLKHRGTESWIKLDNHLARPSDSKQTWQVSPYDQVVLTENSYK